MMALCKIAAGAAICLGLVMSARQAGSETIGQMMSRVCPMARAADIRAERQAALDDPKSLVSYRQAATLYYDCAQRLSNPFDAYARDWAMRFYASDLYVSAQTNGDVLQRSLIAEQAANDLAASTHFSDVRRSAIELRERMKKHYREAYNVIYGHYPEETFGAAPEATARADKASNGRGAGCPGIALVQQADTATSASDHSRAIDLYQRGIEELSACMDNWPHGNLIPFTLWYNRAAAHISLSAGFEDAGRIEDARIQYMLGGGDAAVACGNTKTAMEALQLKLEIALIVRLSKDFPDLLDLSALSSCAPSGLIPSKPH